MYDYDQVKELVHLVATTGVGELEVERNGFRLRIVGHMPTPTAYVSAPPALPVAAPVPAEPPRTSANLVGAGAVEESSPEPGVHQLTSPIVGTFYAAPGPDAEAFVRVGDEVKRGQVVCIVEAMKLMNEIEADVDGQVVEVLRENAEAVEFGQPLFSIRTE